MSKSTINYHAKYISFSWDDYLRTDPEAYAKLTAIIPVEHFGTLEIVLNRNGDPSTYDMGMNVLTNYDLPEDERKVMCNAVATLLLQELRKTQEVNEGDVVFSTQEAVYRINLLFYCHDNRLIYQDRTEDPFVHRTLPDGVQVFRDFVPIQYGDQRLPHRLDVIQEGYLQPEPVDFYCIDYCQLVEINWEKAEVQTEKIHMITIMQEHLSYTVTEWCYITPVIFEDHTYYLIEIDRTCYDTRSQTRTELVHGYQHYKWCTFSSLPPIGGMQDGYRNDSFSVYLTSEDILTHIKTIYNDTQSLLFQRCLLYLHDVECKSFIPDKATIRPGSSPTVVVALAV